MPSKKGFMQNLDRKAQAGLEYLITYGWALIAIATIIGVLVFVASGGINTNTCTTFLKLVCKGIVADGDTLVMVLQNACGQKISITPFEDICFDGICGYGKIEYGDKTYRFETVKIGTGEQFKVIGAGQVLAGEIRITYKEEQTGLEKTVTSTLGTNAPKTTEISNDAIDNDEDNLKDCADTGTIGPAHAAITDCQYVSGAIAVSDTTITNSLWVNIGFGQLTGTSGNTLPGNWKTKSVILVFYVDSFTTGTKPKIEFRGVEISSPAELKQGWNAVEMDATAAGFFSGTTILMVSLESQGAQFTILNDAEHKPKAVFVINKFP